MGKVCFLMFGWLVVIGFGGAAFSAESAGADYAILNAGVGARALGMGGAFSAVADNADAPYWNPAGLGEIKNCEITTMQTRLSTDADHYYVSFVQPWWGGVLGISWIQLGLGSIAETSAEVSSYNEVVNLSIFNYFSNAFLLAWGQEVKEGLSLGITVKYLTADLTGIAGGQAYGYSLTPALKYKPHPKVAVGLKVAELVNEQSWGTGTVEKASPTARLGLALDASPLGLLAVDFNQVLSGGSFTEIALGYEWKQRGLALRAGLAGEALSAGAGFETGNVALDYAYVQQNALSRENVHRVSLSGKW